MFRKRFLTATFLILTISTCFAISPKKYQKLVKIKSELLLVTHKKLDMIDEIYQLKNDLSDINFPEKKEEKKEEPNHSNLSKKQLQQKIKAREAEIDTLDKRITFLNQEVTYMMKQIY